MNFIAETDRFARDIENWKKGHGYTNTEGLKDLMAIWHTFVNLPERKAVTYPGVTAEIPLVDHNCGKCGPLTDALTLIYNWRNSKELQAEVYVDFKGVPQAEVILESDKIVVKLTPVADQPKDGKPFIYIEPHKNDYASMKMHQLRSIAKGKGIPYTNKTKAVELIALLNG